MNMTAEQPEPIPNLIARVRADSMKVFTPLAREQLISQARAGEHSVGASQWRTDIFIAALVSGRDKEIIG
jgi:hypothetical protein